jgi:hypothetical protein
LLFPSERFWSHVDKSGECWLWTGAKNKGGYGYFRLDGKQRYAHIVIYEAEVGPIPEGLELDHVKARGCTSPSCVRVAHLEPVTRRENLMRSTSFVADNATKTHCPENHPYDMVDSAGRRCCRTCRRRQWREWARAHYVPKRSIVETKVVTES